MDSRVGAGSRVWRHPRRDVDSGGPGGTILTNPDGSYKFKLLIGGGYTVAAPAAAGTLARSTPSPLSVALGPGENRTDVNFGYVSGGTLEVQRAGSGEYQIDGRAFVSRDLDEALRILPILPETTPPGH